MKEFELIKHFEERPGTRRKDVEIGIGDDAAIINIPANQQLVVTTDTLVEGIHFFSDMDPRALAHRAIAVNLSDIAAMGAEPAWISLAVTLPFAAEGWVKDFSDSVYEICEYYNVQVIGGDTTQGPMAITISAKGLVPTGKAMTRSGAKPGDWIYVSGTLGDAACAIDAINQRKNLPLKYHAVIKNRFEYPTPRVALAQGLREVASAAIDVSDGLIADLGHIMDKSEVGAVVNVEDLPISDALSGSAEPQKCLEFALSGGDDYELLFTVPEDKRGALDVTVAHYGINLTCIGQVSGQRGKLELRKEGQPFTFEGKGYQHFSED